MKDKSIMTANGFEIYCNSGNLFKNNSENPQAPKYKGLINIDGKGYDLAIWKDDRGFLNTKFTEHKISHDKDGVREEYSPMADDSTVTKENLQVAQEQDNKKDEFNDDIPF
jgi:hypothetical protein|tara:strand:+ start:79 stop:411 length:333 start_codon:yes stop_codon:yes gene_type:complete